MSQFARGRAARGHHRPPARRHRAHRHHAFGRGPQAPAGLRHPGGRDLGPDADAASTCWSASRTPTVGRAVADFLHARGRRRLAVDRRRRRARARAAARPSATRRGRSGCRDVAGRSSCRRPTTLSSGRDGAGRTAGATPPDVDAVFCSSDLLALGVMTEAQARGIDVPGRLAVVGFGDLDFAADLEPALTTVRIDGAAIGRPGGAVHRRPRRGPRGRRARGRHRLLDRRARERLTPSIGPGVKGEPGDHDPSKGRDLTTTHGVRICVVLLSREQRGTPSPPSSQGPDGWLCVPAPIIPRL